MVLSSQDVAFYADPNEVPAAVEGLTTGGYLAAVVAAVLIYDARE